MCAHESPQEAARCECTGYGFGDPPCRCGHPRSEHVDGTGACVVPTARCHEFVLHLNDPFPVTVALIQAAATEIVAELDFEPLLAHRAATAALLAGHHHAVHRDYEITSVRAQNDRLRKQLKELQRQLDERTIIV